ncbi:MULTISPECIES: cell wall metabolism sensor histidine kinase WalK [Paenibacillus]|uniref:histidine kinase n=1 Tax=Paenibacillus odorifer TaxID=189426 RepID=A0ABX3GW33_9BACL|nr:HAMP domain-containing sensor histidine kinase [Paenibacillus odorifer]OMC77092.1 two-component sensor histidine kinase [Paenibacillus odorifer]OMD36621.1 two-component sensor histidine kinase [Paenibacillus odorifer]OMD82701.1 two-component sensor histidine kinase [Paenibacillus odorifer]OMD92103.1 two-component sensor histidine kinase [Paenibacillus odorifer]OMD98934.1 two-component sensor histidine kinase [Paenibacillus odorifer]
MKLAHQINLAFSIALVLLLSITAVVIHFVLLNHFVGTQKEDLRTIGAAMSVTLTEESKYIGEIGTQLEALPVTLPSLSTAGVEAILSDETGKVLSTSSEMSSIAINYDAKSVTGQATELQNIWNGTDTRYITEVKATPIGTLTLLTPMSAVTAIEQALLKRLLIVFSAAGAFMFLFGLFITKKLIQPLMRLQQELRKVKERHFSDVKLIKAGGELGSVAQSVYDMADELNRFNHVQKQFFQNASHELKTPLMSISGYAEGIKDGVFEGENVVKGLDIIMSESSRLKKLVSEMTLLAKLDSEEDIFKPTVICLKDLLTETIERMNPLLMKKELTLHISHDHQDSLTIRADRDKLLQALLNVVSNAARYANQHIYIHVSVKEGRALLSVSDDGPGISDDLLPYLFHRFVKGKDGESGLGLAISRAIIERCGGQISAGNRRNGGAVISMGFPL